MNPQDHASAAEQLLSDINDIDIRPDEAMVLAAAAQVHATLALTGTLALMGQHLGNLLEKK